MATETPEVPSYRLAQPEVASLHQSTPDGGRTNDVNRAFVLSPSRTFSFEDRSVPELPSSRHVRIRIVATGLCGSDVSAYATEVHLRQTS